MTSISEMINFLDISSRIDLKAVSLQYVLGLTGSKDGIEILLRQPKLLKTIVQLCSDGSTVIAKDALLTLVNITAEESGSRTLLDANSDIVAAMLNIVLDPDSQLADPACMVLSNISRPATQSERVVSLVEEASVTLEQLVDVCANTAYNKRGASLHYLAPLLSNLCQAKPIRRYLLDRERDLIQRLLPFTEYVDSNVRRGGIVGVLKNCCFEPDCHAYLLGSSVDLLPRVLLPLAGPDEFDEEDNEKLPIELQYLPPDKAREEDPDIRKMLLECLQQLCGTRECREIMRERNAYLILRQLHQVEKDRAVLLCCENVVDILIRTEDEIGPEHENLHQIEVPEEYKDKFHKMDEEFINDT